MSGELWLAEGFTQYYGPLALQRAGLADLRRPRRRLTDLIDVGAAGAGPRRCGRRRR